MADVYLYMDETGDLDVSGNPKASFFFGLGSALFVGDHRQQVWEGMQLRFQLESEGLRLPKGLHAHEDRRPVRYRVFDLLAKHNPRVDVTLLRKDRAYPHVREQMVADEFYLYRLAWYLHFKYLARYVIPRQIDSPEDRVFIIAASLGVGKKKELVRRALESVCAQFPQLNATLCIWDSTTSWGLQVADYALWTTYRRVRDGYCPHYATVYDSVKSVFRPWEDIKQRPAISEKTEKRAPGSLITDRPASRLPQHALERHANPEPAHDPHWWEYVEPEAGNDPWSDYEPELWEVDPDPETDPWFADEDPAQDYLDRRRLEEESPPF